MRIDAPVGCSTDWSRDLGGEANRTQRYAEAGCDRPGLPSCPGGADPAANKVWNDKLYLLAKKQRLQKRWRGNQLIHGRLIKTKSVGRGEDPESQTGRQSDGYSGWCLELRQRWAW